MSREHVTQWIRLVAADMLEHPEQRQGQRAFNTLCAFQPHLAEQYRSTDLDPFYMSERVPKFVLVATKELMDMAPDQSLWIKKVITSDKLSLRERLIDKEKA